MSGRSLADVFRRLIDADGAISLQQFMGEANARYYSERDPMGAGGDFITAPEISQVFGELIGLWLADIWLRSGASGPPLYVELGPGRGTLAKDALRAMASCGLQPGVHFVEASAALRTLQAEAVPQAQFHSDLSSVPADRPLLIVANEFLDALPIRQLVKTAEGWRERMVGMDADGHFVFVAGTRPMDAAIPPERRKAGQGTIMETCPAAAAVMSEVAERLARQGGAALFIDYGYAERRTGSTFQAVARHRKVDPFQAPGQADLTAHVDFATLAQVATAAGAVWLGTLEQGEWLKRMGIDVRSSALSRAAPARRQSIREANERLTAPGQMGELFKVMGLVGPGWPSGAAFE